MSDDIDLVDLIDGFLEDIVDMVTQHARRTTDDYGNIILDSGGLSANRSALAVLADIGILRQTGDSKYPQYVYEPGASAVFIERIRKQYESLKSRAAVGDAVGGIPVWSSVERVPSGFIYYEFVCGVRMPAHGITLRAALGLKAKEDSND